jgi:biotin carboxyl carrier protein
MTGRITSIDVKPGDVVKEDDTLGILEAMKMENPIIAPVSGTVVEIKVSEGQAVSGGDEIIVIEY